MYGNEQGEGGNGDPWQTSHLICLIPHNSPEEPVEGRGGIVARWEVRWEIAEEPVEGRGVIRVEEK